MIRALYTAASGMNAQQANIDNVAHNLANVNTTGFKKSRVEFEDLVYQQLRTPGTATSQETEAPIGLEAGLGSRPVATARNFGAGSLRATNSPLDLAIEGSGFFEIETPGGTRFTRAGNFKVQSDGLLTTMEDMPVAGVDGEIRLPVGPVMVTSDGTIRVGQTIAGKVKVVRFDNEDGLVRESGTRFHAPDGVDATEVEEARIFTRSLELSNVSVVERVAVLTETSRAFEALQKGISVLMNEIDGRAINELGRK